MPKNANDFMREALERVIGNDGFALDPNSLVHTKGLRAAWATAKSRGLLRPVTSEEEKAYIQHRRSVRTVLLAMFNDAVEDETRDAIWDDRRPSVNDLGDRLDAVAFEIRNTRDDSGKMWTLTDAGVARLEELNA